MSAITEAILRLENFTGKSLTKTIAQLERNFTSSDKIGVTTLAETNQIDLHLLDSALAVKQIAGQINVIIHAIGILLLLPHILLEQETIEYLSLGAGNTGKNFDLETDYRIAEFKFIQWRGGSEAIRQNNFFKDFSRLAEAETYKQRFLYVIGDKHPLKFLSGKRSLKSVMSKDRSLQEYFHKQHGERFSKVAEYYHFWPQNHVHIVDVAHLIPNFASVVE